MLIQSLMAGLIRDVNKSSRLIEVVKGHNNLAGMSFEHHG
jgi:hypothetical protein